MHAHVQTLKTEKPEDMVYITKLIFSLQKDSLH